MPAHPAPRATRAIRAETAGSSGLALGPNQRGKAGGEVEASIPVMAMARQRTRRRVRRRTHPPRRGSIVPPMCRRVPLRPDAPMDVVNPFRGNFGSEDSGQTNDGPLVEEGTLLSGHASSRVGEPGPWTGISVTGQPREAT